MIEVQTKPQVDGLSRVIDTLDAGPALPDHLRHIYLHGGVHRYYGKRPPRTEAVLQADGLGGYRKRVIDLERDGISHCPVSVSSREMSLSITRGFLNAGWDQDDTESMMMDASTLGTLWLRTRKDPHRDFIRMWEKAQIPTSELQKRRSRLSYGIGEFISHPSDRNAVETFIESHPGLCRNDLLRSGCLMRGRHIEGRIKAALIVLKAQGRIFTESGPNRAQFHYVSPTKPKTFSYRLPGKGYDPVKAISEFLASLGGMGYAPPETEKPVKAPKKKVNGHRVNLWTGKVTKVQKKKPKRLPKILSPGHWLTPGELDAVLGAL